MRYVQGNLRQRILARNTILECKSISQLLQERQRTVRKMATPEDVSKCAICCECPSSPKLAAVKVVAHAFETTPHDEEGRKIPSHV